MEYYITILSILFSVASKTYSYQSQAVNREIQGIFELRLNHFTVNNTKSFVGCCTGGNCSSAIKFRICLKHYQETIDPQHDCTFGESNTPVYNNKSLNDNIMDKIIAFPLDFKWPETFSLIIEAWHQNNDTSECLISRMATRESLKAGALWSIKSFSESSGSYKYEYRVLCSTHYYGQDCDTLCRPRDDQFGHYTCGPKGDKICLPGWEKDPSRVEGNYCTKPKCLSGCHAEHGTCSLPGECSCRTGWTGKTCEECIQYPGCVNGFCNSPYECKCREGWGGLFCNNDLNYCTNHEPCQNGATCSNTGEGSYTCSCSPGYSGTNCEKRIRNECSHSPCLHGGTCTGSYQDYKCVCPLGFTGNRCETKVQSCYDKPCTNGGTCKNKRGSFVCECSEGFTGVYCSEKIDHCRKNPCANSGTCSLTTDGYNCTCSSGFSGPNCETNIDDCSTSPCQNSGTCIDFVNDYKCYCPSGFTGSQCEINVDNCLHSPCANGGRCTDLIGDFKCSCPPGFSGKDCTLEINECDSSPCLHNGFCIDRLSDFECRCLPGYHGKTCSLLPDGSLSEALGEGHKALIGTFSALIPSLVIFAVLIVWCNKRKRYNETIRSNASAARENELNAVHVANKTKMLDDHMIVNALDYPKQKCINTNNIDDERLSEKQSVYKQLVKDNKMLNTDYRKNTKDRNFVESLLSCRNTYQERQLSKGSSSSNLLISGASSVCSSENSKGSSKDYGLPTAASIKAEASASASTYSSSSSSSVYVIDPHKKYINDVNSCEDDLLATEV